MQLIISISDAQPGISWNKSKYFIYNRHKGKNWMIFLLDTQKAAF